MGAVSICSQMTFPVSASRATIRRSWVVTYTRPPLTAGVETIASEPLKVHFTWASLKSLRSPGTGMGPP